MYHLLFPLEKLFIYRLKKIFKIKYFKVFYLNRKKSALDKAKVLITTSKSSFLANANSIQILQSLWTASWRNSHHCIYSNRDCQSTKCSVQMFEKSVCKFLDLIAFNKSNREFCLKVTIVDLFELPNFVQKYPPIHRLLIS